MKKLKIDLICKEVQVATLTIMKPSVISAFLSKKLPGVKRYFVWIFVMVLMAACAPRVTEPTGLESEPARQAQAIAEEAYHRMEIGKLQTGEYSPNALIDLELPRGILWTIESFGADSYRLRVASQAISDYSWLVTPEGVQLLTAVSPPG